MDSSELAALKGKRSKAQASFSKKANKLSLTVDLLEKKVLIDEIRALAVDFGRVHDAGLEYVDALGEVESEKEKEQAGKEAAHVKEKTATCLVTYTEALELARETLWSKFAYGDFKLYADGAEEKCTEVEGTDVKKLPQEDFEVLRESLVERIRMLQQKVLEWEGLLSGAKTTAYKQQLYKLGNRLHDWVRSWQKLRRTGELNASDGELSDSGEEPRIPNGVPVPAEPVPVVPASPYAPPQNIPDLHPGFRPQINLERTRLPMFSGDMTDYYRWKAEWEELEQLGNPRRTAGVTRFHLLASLSDRVKKDLVLSSCASADEMFRRLDNRFGNKAKIVLKISEEVQALPPVKGDNPRKAIELIQAVERALSNLVILGEEEVIKNRWVAQSLESKLPSSLKEKWIAHKTEPVNGFDPHNHFDCLLCFLKKQEVILEELDQLEPSPREGSASVKGPADRPERGVRKAFSKATSGQRESPLKPRLGSCTACADETHTGRLFACKAFREMDLQRRKAHLKTHGICNRCLCMHLKDGRCNQKFLCSKLDCRKEESHHYLLCPKSIAQEKDAGSEMQGTKRMERKGLGLTSKQEELLAKVTPELRAEFRKAFTNKASTTICTVGGGLKEYPVVMMLLEVTTNSGQLIGTLIDLASDTNYITNNAAQRLGLIGESIKLIVHGIGGMTTTVPTKRYSLRLRVKTTKGTVMEHKLLCYGLESIAEISQHVTPQQLQKIFPDVAAEELVRPENIDLLISHREGRLVPQPFKLEGDLVLWDGPLGKTVAGTHPDLFEVVDLTLHQSETHFARSMRTSSRMYKEVVVATEDLSDDPTRMEKVTLSSTTATSKEVFEWFKWDSIGAACDPKCGSCKCSKCPPGGKEMTLGEERDLEKIKDCLSYVLADKHSDTPHWDAAYPWKVSPAILPDNRRAVEATFKNTEARLAREPVWKAAYGEQIHEMVSRGAAIKLTKEEIEGWNGPIWYISHLVAPNPHSSSTPVRIVWNSSQEFKGLSLNNLLHKGPDVLNPIRGVLLRFRSRLYAALGDVKKMYNSVWLKDEEVHLHRFLWRDNPEDEICVFAVVRVNIGDKPAGCIAQIAMRETANLPQFTSMVEERRILTEDCYVDDILTSHNDLQTLFRMTKGVEKILKAGGFSLKPWVLTGQSGRSEKPTDSSNIRLTEPKTLILPNQMRDEENKALGLGYEPESDKLRVLTSVNFSRRRGKMRTGLDLREDEIRGSTPDPLTRRMLLSQIAGFYDPIGLASPAKQRGVMLIRESFQEAGRDHLTKDIWDNPLSPRLREAAITLFEQYVRLGQLRFDRSLTPHGAIGRPMGITFSDGSEASYGAILYLRWETEDGVVVKLVESKAKLTPLDQKGDVIKAELCGAVFACRLKTYFEKHCYIQVARWIHFVDSQTILGAIQKDSYGYQTFFANRIGEIHKAGSVDSWRWVEGRQNIADIITRGASPEELGEGSVWQEGPQFLKLPESDWPVKTAREINPSVTEEIGGLRRKAFSALVKVEAQPRKWSGSISVALVHLVDPQKFSSQTRLCGTIAWMRRAVGIWLGNSQAPGQSKWEARPYLSVEERATAFKDLALAAQDGVEFRDTTLDRLVVQKEEKTGLLLCGGRIQSWNKDRVAVPLIPCQSWLATLLASEAHEENHEGVASTLLRTRKKAWIMQGRRTVKKVLNNCVTCRKQRAKMCQQVMSNLPQERTKRASPFEYTTLDLFGPFEVKDSVKRRTSKKVWGIVFCCMTSRAIHADLTDDQSSESFLQAYSRFVALRGHPRKLWSDRGTNFVGAKPAMHELHKHLACLQAVSIEDVAAKNGTEWKWDFHPADAPHRNGAAEAAVKLLKRALMSLGGATGSLTWGELQTLFYQAANLTNERPIDARAQEQEDSVGYLTPNSLILGRASLGGDTSGLDLETHSWRRLRAIQIGVDQFWAKWRELAGPNLFIRHKWHRTERNVKAGDLVWIADPNALRGQFRLGRILTVYPDSKGIVRDADIATCAGLPVSLAGGQKKRSSSLPMTVIRRDVRRLVVLLPVEEKLHPPAAMKPASS
ncbi:uncharacterized protein LOC134078694 [Sardina pilchardus]|uniref:uncharacterized protein LOC134078694 n=1 Tax=Sardina pilchardus TaxID=27697 RepID=UPI002E14427D